MHVIAGNNPCHRGSEPTSLLATASDGVTRIPARVLWIVEEERMLG